MDRFYEVLDSHGVAHYYGGCSDDGQQTPLALRSGTVWLRLFMMLRSNTCGNRYSRMAIVIHWLLWCPCLANSIVSWYSWKTYNECELIKEVLPLSLYYHYNCYYQNYHYQYHYRAAVQSRLPSRYTNTYLKSPGLCPMENAMHTKGFHGP